jgi:hypothetical protein
MRLHAMCNLIGRYEKESESSFVVGTLAVQGYVESLFFMFHGNLHRRDVIDDDQHDVGKEEGIKGGSYHGDDLFQEETSTTDPYQPNQRSPEPMATSGMLLGVEFLSVLAPT